VDGAKQEQGAAKGSFPFPRSARLLKHAAFDRVYREGRRIFSGNLTVFFRERGAEEPFGCPRVGFTVGRTLGGAVERNRIKRRMRDAVRHGLAVLSIPVDVVINPKKAVLKADFGQLQGEVRRAFTQIQHRSQSAGARTNGARPAAQQR
jgi:ribonuclease P protein component